MNTRMGDKLTCNPCRNAASKQAALLFFIIVLMLLAYGCIKTPAEPAMPSWQTQITLPIVDRTYYFSELVAKSKNGEFETMVNGEVYYRPANVNNTPTAIPLPNVYPADASVTTKLGAVPLTIPALPSVELSLTQLLGQAPPPLPWLFGEINITQTQDVISDTATYDYVTFEKGRITITLTNTMNFDISFPAGVQVVNVFSNNEGPRDFVTFSISQLKANSSQVLSADVSGLTMSSRLQMKYTIQTIGMNGQLLTTGKISSAMAIDGGTVGSSSTMRSAKVVLNGDYGSVRDSSELQLINDSTFIKRADFNSGMIDLKISNTVPLDIVAGLAIKELVNKKTGKAFRLKVNGTGAEADEVTIPRNTTFVQTVNLSEYTFISQKFSGSDTIPTASVKYVMSIRSSGPTTDKRVVTSSDAITASITPRKIAGAVQPLTVSKFEGVIKPTTVFINEAVKTDFGTITDNFSADSIKFENAAIVLKLFTKTTYPADIDLKVTAYRNGVRGQSMRIPSGNGGMNGAYRIIPGDTARIIFNKATTTTGLTIDQFMNSFTTGGKLQLPDKLMLEGTGTIEPLDLFRNGTNGYVGRVTNGDSIFSAIEFYFPVRMAIQNGIFRDTTEFTNKLEQKNLDLVENGKVIFQIENSFPVAADVSLMLMSSKQTSDTLLNVTKTPLHVESATYKEGGPNTVNNSYTFVTLAKGEASKFGTASFAAVKAHMQTASGGSQPVSFRTTDHIRVKAYGSFNMTVDFNKITADDK